MEVGKKAVRETDGLHSVSKKRAEEVHGSPRSMIRNGAKITNPRFSYGGLNYNTHSFELPAKDT